MKINLTPRRDDAKFTVSVTGDAIIIDGIVYDFGPLPDGAILPHTAVDCAWIASDVARVDGQITLTLILPHGPDASEETRFPEPITVAEDGPVALPLFSARQEEGEA